MKIKNQLPKNLKENKPYPPLTDEDALEILKHTKTGNIEAAKKIIESKGLEWDDGSITRRHPRHSFIPIENNFSVHKI